MKAPKIGVVIIGRNEATRLPHCLRSLPAGAHTLYVDSGSTDGSCEVAESCGIAVSPLSPSQPFSAARARNSGFSHLMELPDHPDYVQFVDGDCTLAVNWINQSSAALQANPTWGAVFGRLREKFPDQSIYNRMCDDEWNVPVGPAISSGGVVLFRSAAFLEAGGFDEALLAGEEIDLCKRVARRGWRIERIDAEMGHHDADMHRFGQWWRRTRRSGQAYAQHMMRHGKSADAGWARQSASILFWAILLPIIVMMMLALGAVTGNLWWAIGGVMMAGLYLLQIMRIFSAKRASGFDGAVAMKIATLLVTGKFAQAVGMVEAAFDHLFKRSSKLVEYRSG